jgi:hypothetical protein
MLYRGTTSAAKNIRSVPIFIPGITILSSDNIDSQLQTTPAVGFDTAHLSANHPPEQQLNKQQQN